MQRFSWLMHALWVNLVNDDKNIQKTKSFFFNTTKTRDYFILVWIWLIAFICPLMVNTFGWCWRFNLLLKFLDLALDDRFMLLTAELRTGTLFLAHGLLFDGSCSKTQMRRNHEIGSNPFIQLHFLPLIVSWFFPYLLVLLVILVWLFLLLSRLYKRSWA